MRDARVGDVNIIEAVARELAEDDALLLRRRDVTELARMRRYDLAEFGGHRREGQRRSYCCK